MVHLSGGRRGEGEHRGCRKQHLELEAVHAASPALGRTVTTRIIPAVMW